jgi:hypothetical protein
MANDETSPMSDNLAVRYGLRFGYAAGLAGSAAGVLTGLALAPGGQGLLCVGCLPFLITLYLFGEVGHWTARRVGTISSGTLAAALSGLFGGFGLAVGFYGIRLLTHQVPATKATGAGLVFALAVGTVVGALADVALFAGIGAGVGAFGASIGRDQHRKQPRINSSPGSIAAQSPGSGSPEEPHL